MKIILVIMKYDYGIPARGESYEYYNFFCSLKKIGHDVSIFDYMSLMNAHGKENMNKMLLDTAKKENPDLMIFSLYTDQIEPRTVSSLRTITKTLCFFHDDTWRVDFSRYWAGHFDYFTTPDIYGVYKYRKLGMHNAHHFPFGANHELYKRLDVEKIYDVSFVGGWHPYRQWLIEKIRKSGINVHTFGSGWKNGIVPHEEMVKIFNQSKINLNLSNSSNWDARYLISSPRGLLSRLRSKKTVEQLKARHFEIAATSSFQLSYYVEGLESYYKIGKEIGIFADIDDLVEKVHYYLEDSELRENVANAGYTRTLQEHSFEARFGKVFREIGLI
ncbi:CgeB family protein [Vogesella indigofera]|uniref:Glycosyltransferase n=1 Tax=Vogesella indigofera TaxID=45465 RepID=A0ABT5I0G8_VOGIN|nr:glycosyltransferase [Vogesella indigofera]MDC7689664.1 glycosyltransferase [Vogesella indigofera]